LPRWQAEANRVAVLKELFLSSKMRWIANPQQGTMGEVMSGQVSKLREQMVSAEMFMAPNPEDQQEVSPQFGSMMRVRRRRQM
jgi:hypothetical protein